MFEKVNPSHPDKIADRIAGAIVDLAYKAQDNPKIAVEVLIGHGVCHVIAETSVDLNHDGVMAAITRIAGNIAVDLRIIPQDVHLARNQEKCIRCGDNGIFKGVPVTVEQNNMSNIAKAIYADYPYDGKYIMNGSQLIICQSNADSDDLKAKYPNAIVNLSMPRLSAKTNTDSLICVQ